MTSDSRATIPFERIYQKIFVLRGQKVMLDRDLAEFYGVSTFNLNKAVARNSDRFPNDFMFQLNAVEFKEFSKLFGGSSYGGRRSAPYAFTEQGVAMLSAVLQSKRAVEISVQIMRSFVRLRELLLSNEGLAQRLRSLEAKAGEHARLIVQIIDELHKPPESKERKIGF